MAIVGLLVGLGVTVIPYLMRKGPQTAAQTYLSTLAGALEAYRTSEGAYPPTSLNEFPGVGMLANQENLGIESVVLCLNSTRYTASFAFEETQGGKLENYDNDSTQAQLTRFGTKEMFEVVDSWGTPYAYFNSKDYARGEDLGKITGEQSTLKALPLRNPKTKSWYRIDRFQIISAGPDKTFGTEDDLTDFTRE
jgi:type II secretory pathway pseudopilin PulG